MKLIVATALFLALTIPLVHSQTQTYPEPVPGRYWADDTQGPAQKICYRNTSSKLGDSNATLMIDQGQTGSDFANQFSVSASVEAHFDIFSVGTKESYLNSVQDSQFSFSMNYYAAVTAEMQTDYSYGNDALNDVGQSIYNGGKNAEFRVLCGNRMIESYKVGAAVVFSLIISSTNTETTNTVKSEVSFSVPFVKVMADITASTKNIQDDVTITMKAAQWGGDPTQLPTILNAQTVSCSVQNVSSCLALAQSIYTYMGTDFPTQFTVNPDSIWSTELVYLGKMQLGGSINFQQNLKIHATFATPEVLQARNNVMSSLLNISVYQDYYQNLKTSACQSQLNQCSGSCNTALNTFMDNIGTLQQLYNQYALDCWFYPAQCLSSISKINKATPKIDYEGFHNQILPTLLYTVDVSFNGATYDLKHEWASDSDLEEKWDYNQGGVDISVSAKSHGKDYDVSFKYSAPTANGGHQSHVWSDRTYDSFFDSSDFDSRYDMTSLDDHISVDISGAGNKKNMDLKFKKGACNFPTQFEIEKFVDAIDFSSSAA